VRVIITLISGDIRFMPIFAGFYRKEASNDRGIARSLMSRTSSSLAFENNFVKTYTDRPVLVSGNIKTFEN